MRWLLLAAAALAAILLFLLASASANTALFAGQYRLLLGFSAAVATTLLGLVLWQLRRLWREHRAEVFGSRLKLRLVLMFALMAVVPGALVYAVSLQFAVKSIESWFDVRVDKALEGGLNLGRNALDYLLADLSEKARTMALELGDASGAMRSARLNRLREQAGVQTATLVSPGGQVIASSTGERAALLPDLPSSSQLRQARQGLGVSAVEGDAASGLTLRVLVPVTPLAFTGETLVLQLTQAAQDAHVTINGLEVTSTTNRLTDVIENLTLELRRTTTAPIDVSVDSDTAALRKSLDGFVEAWNAVNTLIADQVRFDPATKTAGVLQGNQTVVRVQQQLREILRSTVGTDAPNSLSALGVELQRDGSLKVDDTRAGAALADPKKAQAFFAAQGTTPGEPGGMARRVLASLDALLASDGAISGATESLRARERSVAQQEERLNARLNEIEKRLLRQYTALDANLTRMAGSLSSVQNLLAGLERPA